MASRFSRYKFALKANGGGAATGTALEKYKKYATKETVPTYTRDGASNPGTFKVMYLCPFSAGVGEIYSTVMSQRSFDALGTIADNAATVFNHITPGADPVITAMNYVPAKAIANLSGTGTSKEPSKITGVQYTKETGAKSHTVPFGCKKTRVIGDTVLDTLAAIRAAIKAKSVESVVSFKPEMFRG
jgi:hypothetical protein